MVDEAVRLDARENYFPPRLQDDGSFVMRVRGETPLEKAMVVAELRGVRLPIWSLDLPNPKDIAALRGKKCFYIASYSAFRDFYRDLPQDDRCVYEIIRDDEPTQLYVDVDMQREHNETIGDVVLQQKLDVLVEETIMMANEIRGVPVDTPLDYVVLDSSKASKASKHYVFHFYLKNNYHCGAFMRKVRNRISKKYESATVRGDRDRDHPFYLWAEVKDPTKPKSGIKMRVRTYLADLAVYTMRRNFRIYGSAKRIMGAIPLRGEGESDGTFNWDTYDRSILQRRTINDVIYECLEEDGSEPISKSDTNFLRHDMPEVVASVMKKGRGASGGSSTGFAPAHHLIAHWTNVFPFDLVFGKFAPPTPPLAPVRAGAVFKREFRFAFAGDKWSRERLYDTSAEFRASVLRELPHTIHIGPVREFDASGALLPISDASTTYQPSLVFDIDINDSKIPRPCCGTNGVACATCWPIAEFAQQVIVAFATALGLGTPVCFFSGGKGVHIWMVNSIATPLHRQESRLKLMNYLRSVLGKGTRDAVFPDKPAMTTPGFVQDALGPEPRRVYYTNFIRQSMHLHADFDRHASRYGRDSAIVHALWPAVDEDVTTDPRHKIKAPFCTHARTSKVCVWLPNAGVNPYVTPIDPTQNAADLRKLLHED